MEDSKNVIKYLKHQYAYDFTQVKRADFYFIVVQEIILYKTVNNEIKYIKTFVCVRFYILNKKKQIYIIMYYWTTDNTKYQIM